MFAYENRISIKIIFMSIILPIPVLQAVRHRRLPRTQMSLDEMCMQRKAGSLYPSHGPLRLITSRSPLPCEKQST